MTKEQLSTTRASASNTVDQTIQFKKPSKHRSASQSKQVNRHDELPRSKSILRKKSLGRSQRESVPNDQGLHHQLSSRSSFSSEDVESSHTIINELPESNYISTEKNNNAEYNPNQATTYDPKTYPVAWLLLFLVVVLRAAIAIFGNTFSPIPSVTAEFMGVSLSSINWLYNTMSICYIIASFFTSWLYQAIGVKWSVSSWIFNI